MFHVTSLGIVYPMTLSDEKGSRMTSEEAINKEITSPDTYLFLIERIL
jgi:hypothetical protein